MTLIDQIAQGVDFITETRAPLDTDGGRPADGSFERGISQIRQLWSDPAVQLSDLPAFLDALKNAKSVGLDDRKMLLEKVLVLMARFKDSDISMQVQRLVIDLLYKDLPHPPGGYLRRLTSQSGILPSLDAARMVVSPVKYAFRPADGSNYNPLFPSLGKAGSPYARSVPALRPMPKHVLPDPGLVFDMLLRREKFVPHPGGISSLFFAFADLVIHSIFNTNRMDWAVNDNSSYLDLSILYGSSDKEVDGVRRKDGTGKLYEDVFADGRLLFMPPASCALLVLLSRNHNYIAQKLLDINEHGTFISPPPEDDKTRLAQDDEIFNRTRMVNCGFFIQIILGDYVGAILGLVRDGSDWRLDPLMSIRESDHEVSPRGEGNMVSVEFNLLYRWHSTLSAEDTEWTAEQFSKLFEGRDLGKATVDDFKRAARKFMAPPKDVKSWEFGGLKREHGDHGPFKDEDLARIIQDATEHRAAAFRARGTPEALRVIEILGIEQGRSWGTCSLNEFRKFLGLRPYKTFEEWNPAKEIHTAAAALYKDIDNLELHVGLQAEQTKDPVPGAGLCPGYTISRAILADAVCLTRGDPFFTTEFTPFNLTSWGYKDCQYDSKDGSYGGILTKLLFRTLPNHYPAGSAYAHFPFLDPVYMREHVAKDANLVKNYTWTRPRRSPTTIIIDTADGVKQVLSSPHFMSAYNNRMFNIIATPPTNDTEHEKSAALYSDFVRGCNNIESLLPYSRPSPSHESWAEYFRKETEALITEKAIRRVGDNSRYVDIVEDVINLVPVRWISEKILGLPLKTISNRSGVWYEQEVYKMFAHTARYVFLNFDTASDWHLREDSLDALKKISKVTKAHLDCIRDWVPTATEVLGHIAIENHDSHEFLKRVSESGRDFTTEELAAQLFSALVPTTAHFSQVIAHVVDFYLDDDKRKERDEIVRLASVPGDKEAVGKIMVYVREALRLNPPVSGVYRTAGKDAIIEGTRVATGQRIYASIVKANLETTTPPAAIYDKPLTMAGILGLGDYGLLSAQFFESTIPIILGAVLGLKNLKRAGKFARFTEEYHGSPQQWYMDMQGDATPFPCSLIVQFD